MFPGFHGFDLIIPLVIALLIFGPKKLPEMGASIGKSIQEYRKSMREVTEVTETHLADKEVLTVPPATDDVLPVNARKSAAEGESR